MNIRLLSLLPLLAASLLAACSSELKDAGDLPTNPQLIGAHGKGYALIGSENFHGTDIRSRLGWDITGCKSCHGPDYAGGLTNQSCSASGCHEADDGGPEACYVCHGDSQSKKSYPQWYNAHRVHLEGTADAAVTIACNNCHNLPNNFEDPIHVDKTTPGKAEVNFVNAFAETKTKGTVGTPSFDAATGSCSNTYCHGNFTNGNNATVAWKGQDQGKCGSCHGDPATGNPLPKSPHPPVQNCVLCHADVVDSNNQIKDRNKHVNGRLNVSGQERTDW